MSTINPDNKPARDEILVEPSKEGQRLSLCRCWQSAKFPYCDGSHRAYNEATGEGLGPVVVKVSGLELDTD